MNRIDGCKDMNKHLNHILLENFLHDATGLKQINLEIGLSIEQYGKLPYRAISISCFEDGLKIDLPAIPTLESLCLAQASEEFEELAMNRISTEGWTITPEKFPNLRILRLTSLNIANNNFFPRSIKTLKEVEISQSCIQTLDSSFLNAVAANAEHLDLDLKYDNIAQITSPDEISVFTAEVLILHQPLPSHWRILGDLKLLFINSPFFIATLHYNLPVNKVHDFSCYMEKWPSGWNSQFASNTSLISFTSEGRSITIDTWNAIRNIRTLTEIVIEIASDETPQTENDIFAT
ncbi:hypothetical protein ACJ73_09893, partial [Blastomyces percursus]